MTNLTERTVAAIKPIDRRQEVADGAERGLYFVVQPSGARSWVHRYRFGERPVKLTLGTYPSMTLGDARRTVRANRAVLDRGDDPRFAKKQRQAEARAKGFADYADVWLAEYSATRRASGVGQARSVVNAYLTPALKQRPITKIDRADIQAILDGIPATRPAVRRSVHAYANVLFGWAKGRGDIAANPLDDMAKPRTAKARDRVLSDDELRAVWNAAGEMREPWTSFYRLLILTGQRREEVAMLGWGELDREAAIWTLPAERAKNRVAHIAPLSSAVIAIIDRLAGGDEWPTTGYVLTTTGRTAISGFSKAKTRIDRLAPLDSGWRVHDLRRTVATGFQRLGVRFEVTEAVLNHVSGARAGVAGVYQRHDWADEKRAALDAWAAHVEALVA